MNTTTSATNRNPYQEARRACRSIDDREALGRFIKAGWKENELSAFASLFLNPPTKYSYRTVIQLGADHAKAQAFLAKFRDYVSDAALAPCSSPMPPRKYLSINGSAPMMPWLDTAHSKERWMPWVSQVQVGH